MVVVAVLVVIIYLSTYLSICLSAPVSVYLQAWKRSSSERLPQVLNSTTSKTKQFFQKWKVECRADGLVPMRFAIFPLHVSKVLRLPPKSDARSYEVLHLSRKIISANLKIWCSKMQPLSGNQRPDLLTALMNMSLALRLPQKMHLSRSSSHAPRLPSFLEMLQNPHVLLTFDKVHNPLRLPRETTSERPKVDRTCSVCTEPQIIKNSASRLSYLFAHLHLLSCETFPFVIFFLLLFFSLTLPISAFHLSILSEVWLLNDLMLQNATLLRKSAPGPPNSSDEHVPCIAPATENAS